MMTEVFTCQSCGGGFVVVNSQDWLTDDLMYCSACRPSPQKPLKPIRKRSVVREVPVPEIEIPRVARSRSRSQWARFVSEFFREVTKDHKSRKAFASAVIIMGCLGYAGVVLLPIVVPYLVPKTRYPVPATAQSVTPDYPLESSIPRRGDLVSLEPYLGSVIVASEKADLQRIYNAFETGRGRGAMDYKIVKPGTRARIEYQEWGKVQVTIEDGDEIGYRGWVNSSSAQRKVMR